MSSTVVVIPARKNVVGDRKKEEKKKLRVAAYCRVSTDNDEQTSSYRAQIQHYENYIKNNSEWSFAGIFADEGISGTRTKDRSGFNAMIDSCMNGQIDMVITKSISRFARNTIDCLKYIRKLKEKNIPIFFEKEAINTLDAKGEILITIMASLAQQESQSLSQNIKMGFQYRFQQGKISVNTSRFLGFTKDENGNLAIDEEEAKIIRRIFNEYISGYSINDIKKGLERDGIKTGSGSLKWHQGTIRNILSNEKYMGDSLLQKTYTTDFLTKTRVRNDGIVPQYYVENSHPAIVKREVFLMAHDEAERRSKLRSHSKNDRYYSSTYGLSCRMFCEKCGDVFRRIIWNNKGKKKVVWRCANRVKNGPSSCKAKTIDDDVIKNVIVDAINKLISEREIKKKCKTIIHSAIEEKPEEEIKNINENLIKLQNKLVSMKETDEEYYSLIDEIETLRFKKDYLNKELAKESFYKERFRMIDNFIESSTIKLDEYDDELVKKILYKVLIGDEKIEVVFKSNETVILKAKW